MMEECFKLKSFYVDWISQNIFLFKKLSNFFDNLYWRDPHKSGEFLHVFVSIWEDIFVLKPTVAELKHLVILDKI